MQSPPESSNSDPATKADLRVLKSDVNGLKSDFRDLKTDVDARFNRTDAQIADLRKDMDARFKHTDEQFADLRKDMDARFKHTDEQFADLRKDMDARFKHTDEQIADLRETVAGINGQMPHMATAAQLKELQGDMKAGFAEIRALFIERIIPLEEHKRKSEARHRYLAGVVGAMVVGFVVTAWKVFIGA